MSDLRSRLHDAVDVGDPLPGAARGATAGDDVLVGVLTARVRRRRGLRGAASGALSLVVVAAVAAGGVALAGRDAPTYPPATEGPDEWQGPVCGAEVRVAQSRDVSLSGELLSRSVSTGDPVDLRLTTVNRLGDDVARLHPTFAHVLVLSDGVVVGRGRMPDVGQQDDSTDGGTAETFQGPVDLEACEGGPLPAGSYQVVAAQIWLDPGDPAAPLEVTAGPWDLTVVGADDEVRMPDQALACGEPLPAELPAHAGVGVVVEAAPTVPAGERLPWAVRWWSETGRAPGLRVAEVQVAAVRDGVVVGSSNVAVTYDDGLEPLPTAESSALELSDAAEPLRCGTFLPLPPGEYETVLVLTLVTSELDVLRTTAPAQPLTITPARPRALACGDVAPESPPTANPAAPLVVEGAPQGDLVGGGVPVAAVVRNATGGDLTWPHTVADVAVTHSGLVVATGTADVLPDAVDAGGTATGPVVDVTLEPCDGRPLSPGRYAMWLHAVLDVEGVGPVEMLEGDWPLDVR